MPYEVILEREPGVAAKELGTPATARLVSVPAFVTAVRDAFGNWEKSGSAISQSRFVKAWNIEEISMSTKSPPVTGSNITLGSPEVTPDYWRGILAIKAPSSVNP
jgi:hypothetical protein